MMRRFSVMLALSLMALLVGCSAIGTPTTVDVKIDGASVSIPGSWRVVESNGGKYIYPAYDSMLYISSAGTMPNTDEQSAYEEIIDGLTSDGSISLLGDFEVDKSEGYLRYRAPIRATDGDVSMIGYIDTIFHAGNIVTASFVATETEVQHHIKQMLDILDSIQVDPPFDYPPKPSDMDKETFNIYMDAIDAVKSYLDGETTQADASIEISRLRTRADAYAPENTTSHSILTTNLLVAESELDPLLNETGNTEHLHELLKSMQDACS